jgi:hypothetical protein
VQSRQHSLLLWAFGNLLNKISKIVSLTMKMKAMLKRVRHVKKSQSATEIVGITMKIKAMLKLCPSSYSLWHNMRFGTEEEMSQLHRRPGGLAIVD